MVSKEELEAERKAAAEVKEKERETPEWAAGLKQQREAAERRAAVAAEAAKPFARSKCGTRSCTSCLTACTCDTTVWFVLLHVMKHIILVSGWHERAVVQRSVP